MNKFLKIIWVVGFCTLIALPMLYLFGVQAGRILPPTHPALSMREKFHTILGWERNVDLPAFSLAGFRDRSYQDAFTEAYSKKFFPRATLLRTAYQLREVTNFGLFHYGYGNGVLEGREGIIYERPYAAYHLACPRPGGKARYAEVMKVVTDMNDFCRTNGIFFAFVTMPDKFQAYPEFLPPWLDWVFGYSNYDAQGELAQIFEAANVPVFDANDYLLKRKDSWTTWVYPPGGTHLSSYGSGLVYQGFAEKFVNSGKLNLKLNRFVGVRKLDHARLDEDDISNLMNLWWNPHLASNFYSEPVFEQTNVVLNAGSLVTVGDCYRETISDFFKDAGVFAAKKILAAPRGTKQDPKTYREIAGDLRVVLLCFQSFNTGRLDARKDELNAIFTSIQNAVRGRLDNLTR